MTEASGKSPLAPDWLQVPADLNALHEPLWAAGVERNDAGELTIEGLTVSELQREYGTPLFVLSETDFRARARAFSDAFNDAFADICGGVDVYYAGKSFLCTSVVRWVEEEGLRLDTASGGELAVAFRAGIPGADVALHGNNKSDGEIHRALDMQLGRIVVDSLDELERVAAIAANRGDTARVMLRLTPGVHAHTHEFIATAHEDQKFGLSMAGDSTDQAGLSAAEEAVAAAIRHESIELLGLHCHIGSQIFEPDGFALAAEKLLDFLAAMQTKYAIVLPELDVVVAITSEVEDMQQTLNLLWQHLLPAIDAEVDHDADERLGHRLAELAHPTLSRGAPNGESVEAVRNPGSELPEAFESVRLDTTDEGHHVLELRHPEGDLVTVVGDGEWLESCWPTRWGPQLTIAASGGWADGVFRAELRVVETPHTIIVALDRGAGSVLLSWRLEPLTGPDPLNAAGFPF